MKALLAPTLTASCCDVLIIQERDHFGKCLAWASVKVNKDAHSELLSLRSVHRSAGLGCLSGSERLITPSPGLSCFCFLLLDAKPDTLGDTVALKR